MTKKQDPDKETASLSVSNDQDTVRLFDALRPRLGRIAYRMLGSVADAEDVLQDAFIRWQATSKDDIRTPEAYLRRIVTRLCLDELKSARVQRESYVGTWLPEPLIQPENDELDDVTLPLMMALERLSPLERAAFLLHDVFDVSFTEVAETIGREEAACRQLAHRAREHLSTNRPRFPVSKERGLEIAQAFFVASRNGDMRTLQSLLADDVAVYADGGGKRPAAPAPLLGLDNVLLLFERIAAMLGASTPPSPSYRTINGLPGFVTVEADGLSQTTALEIHGDKIVNVFVMRNPEKLRHLR